MKMGNDTDSICVCSHKQSCHWRCSALYRCHAPCSAVKCNYLCFTIIISWREGRPERLRKSSLIGSKAFLSSLNVLHFIINIGILFSHSFCLSSTYFFTAAPISRATSSSMLRVSAIWLDFIFTNCSIVKPWLTSSSFKPAGISSWSIISRSKSHSSI